MAAPSARLTISPDVNSAFESTTHRAIHLKIAGEALTLHKTSGSLTSPCPESFSGLSGAVDDGDAEFVLFSLEGSEGGNGKWLLVAWVPDAAKVRDKMLYSSSKEDLKKALGLTSFAGDYYANVKSDLTWDAYAASLVKVVSLNEREEALQQEKMDKIGETKPRGQQVAKICSSLTPTHQPTAALKSPSRAPWASSPSPFPPPPPRSSRASPRAASTSSPSA